MNVKKNLLILLLLTVCLPPAPNVSADNCVEAKRWYEKALALADDSDRTLSIYKRVIELCPDYFEAHNKLGEVYKKRGEYEKAIKEFKLARAKGPFAEPYYNLGEIYRMQGLYDEAAEEFIQAVRIQPDYRKALSQLKYVYKRLGMYDTVLYHPSARDRTPSSVFTRITGLSLPKSAFLVDFQFKYWLQKAELTEDIFAPETPPPASFVPFERVTEVYLWILGIRYGLTNDFTIGLIPRLTSRRIFAEDAPVPGRILITGFGDTELLLKYRIYKGRTLQISPYHLLTIPTGDEHASGEDNGLIRLSPLGGGSFNFTPGVAMSFVYYPFAIHGNARYRFTNGEFVGDEFRCDLALAYRASYDLVTSLEVNYRWRDSVRRNENIQTAFFRPESGPPFIPGPGGPIPVPRTPAGPDNNPVTLVEKEGHTLFFSAGVQLFLHDSLKAELGLQIPVIKQDAGWAEQAVLHVGITRYFF